MRAIMVGSSVVLCLILALTVSSSQAVDVSMIGADPGPNATGEIPAWEGNKNTTCPAGLEPGSYIPNPWKGDKPLYRIDHTNVDEYKDRLSPGQIMRIKRFKTFYMNVYKSRRNLEFFPEYYETSRKNMKTARVSADGQLEGWNGAVAFPTPKSGVEAIWNIRRMYMGDDTESREAKRIVSPSGRIRKLITEVKVTTLQGRLLSKGHPNPEGYHSKIRQVYTFPTEDWGRAALLVHFLDIRKKSDAWMYLPTMRRVRRTPTMRDGFQTEGEFTMDDYQEFMGDVTLWDWKLLGKKEMYISENNYDLFLPDATDKDECLPGHLNPQRIRYELRRVWIVEGTLKPGTTHQYSKRVGYYDEDSWMPSMADRYDRRGNLWRMYECYPFADPCQKVRIFSGYTYQNLETGRYDLYGGDRKEVPRTTVYNQGLIDEKVFSVQNLREAAR